MNKQLSSCKGIAKLLYLLVAFVMASTQLNAQRNTDLPHPDPQFMTVPAGTYVIAMDNTLQAGPGYFNVKSYGLIVSILNTRHALHWAIRSGKAKDGIDFSAPATRVFPTFQAAANRDFKAGPFLILPLDSAGISVIINTFNNAQTSATRVNVYQLTAPVTVDIRYILTQIPRAAIMNDGGNQNIQRDYFIQAAVPASNYRIQAAVNLDDSCYTFASEPHSTAVGPTIDSIHAYVNLGGNFLAECKAVNTYENQPNGRFQTTLGVQITNDNITPIGYPNPDLSFSQYEGLFDPRAINGSERNWRITQPGSFKNHGHMHETGTVGLDTTMMGASVAKVDTGAGHLVFYIGGHDYGGSTNINNLNGIRSYFNAMLTPSGVAKCDFLRFDNDLQVVKRVNRTPIFVNQRDTFVIRVYNHGPSTAPAQNVTINDILPAGLAYVSHTASQGTYNPGTGVWFIGQMAIGDSVNMRVVFNSLTPGITVTNYATIVPDQYDTHPGNNRDSAIVTVLGCATVDAGRDATICSNKTVTLGGNPTAIGGQPPYTYSWSPATGLSATNVPNPVANPTVNTIYYVTVTDIQGCVGRDSVIITVNTAPTISASSSSPFYCSGQTINLASLPVGTAVPFTYKWSVGTDTFSTLQNPARINSTTAMSGVYQVTVTDNNQCSGSAATQVTVFQSPTVDANSNKTEYCSGESIVLTSTPSGGLPGYTFQWSGPLAYASTQQNNIIANATVNMSGRYSVTVTDAHTCTATDTTAQLTVHQSPTVVASSNSPVCEGLPISLVATPNGGLPGYTYMWAGPLGFASTTQSPTIATSTLFSGGAYTVTVTDAHLCTGANSTNVSIFPKPAKPTAFIVPNPVCVGSTLYLSAFGNNAGTYNWRGPNGFTSSRQNDSIVNVTLAAAGQYMLFQTLGGCYSDTNYTTVIVYDRPPVPNLATNGNRCWGDTLKLFATTVPPIPGATWFWTGPSGFISGAQNPIITNATPANAGTYTATVTVNGCSATNPDSVQAVVTSCPPVAVNDNYTTPEDVNLIVPAPGVLTNDYDPAHPPQPIFVTTVVQLPANGAITPVSPNGGFMYGPNPNFNGLDSFIYAICDIETPPACDTATVYIIVTPVNDPPVAVNDYYVSCIDTTVIKNVLANDDSTDGPQFIVTGTFGGPTIGTLTMAANGTFAYDPPTLFNGLDTFKYVLCDLGIPNLCDTATVILDYRCVNVPPVAVDDHYIMDQGDTLNGSVAPNDFDLDGGPLIFDPIPVVDVSHGTVTINNAGGFVYIPDSSYFGLDTFVYRVCDTDIPVLCDTATAYITIIHVNHPPQVPDTTVHTPEDSTITVCVRITDVDTMDIHTATLVCNPANGTVTSINVTNPINGPHSFCVTYDPNNNYYGTDVICVKVCDNGVPVMCDTSHITIIIDPRNDPPYADTIIVYTYMNNPVGVNVSSAAGDPEGDPLTFTYGSVTPDSGAYTITGIGTIDVQPDSGFVGTFVIPYTVCDQSLYPITPLCASAAIIVHVIPPPPTNLNNPPVASNDYAATQVNTAVAINELANDYDPNGDYPLAVTIGCLPQHGTVNMNPATQVFNYIPAHNYVGYDTICYTVCDPNAASVPATLPRPLCDNAIVVIFISPDTVNEKPVATDDFAFICQDETVNLNLLQNDHDPNGNALSGPIIIDNFNHGGIIPLGIGIYHYVPTPGYNGQDTLHYVICDNGTPVMCDTAEAVVKIYPLPGLINTVTPASICSQDSFNVVFAINIPGTAISWTATNGTSGTGNIHVVLVNNTAVPQTVTYTVTAVSPTLCVTTKTITVSVSPDPSVTATPNGTAFCSGDLVVVTLTSNIVGTTYTWSGSNGISGTGNVISDNPTNTGIIDSVVTYTIVPWFGNCSGDTLLQNVTVKPRPVLGVSATNQIVCSGGQYTIGLTSNIPGTLFSWTGTNGNSGTVAAIIDATVNPLTVPITVTYTVNGYYNGCPATPVTSLVTIRPQVYADAGVDKNAVACSGSCVVLGGSLPAFGGIGGPYTYNWTPGTNLNDSTIGNPTACGLLNTRTYSLIVTDGSGCASQADYVTVFVTPSGMQAEAGNGGNICRESGDSIQLGGFPTVVGGTPAYTYNWAPTAGLFQTNIANPMAYPVISTRYYVTVTDANGCIAIDSTIVGAYPKLDINAGQASTVCQGTNFQLGGNPTAHGGSGSGYTYIWSPVTGITNATIANPIANASVNTTYQLTVTDGNGCSATDNVVLTVNPSPNAFAGPDKEITNCKDDSVRLGDSPSGSGGTPPLAYLWQPGTGLNDSTISNPTASGLTADQQYVLLVTDANGCIQTDYVDVTVLDRAPSIFVDLPTDSVCPNSPVTVTATYSSNTTNIQWSTVGGPVIANGLAPVTVYPGTGGNYCLVATAQTSLAVCNARDTACIFVLDKCVTVHIDTIYDTIPVNTNDTICVGGYVISSGGGAWTIVTLCDPADGTATTINGDTCFVFSPTSGYTGDAPFCIVVCDAYGCDTGLVIITIIDTNQCHFPNTITPNDDGQNEQFEVSCNDYFPKSEIRIFDRWGAEVYRSTGHYANDWSAKNLQGTKVPDGTYYYLYYFNDGSGRMHKGFVDVYR